MALTKKQLEELVEQQAAAIAQLQASTSGAAKQRKADTITTARYSYREGGDTKLVLLTNKRKRVMLSKAECEAIVKASDGFDWSPGAPVYVK